MDNIIISTCVNIMIISILAYFDKLGSGSAMASVCFCQLILASSYHSESHNIYKR